VAQIHAGTVWEDSGLVFTTLTGKLIAPGDHSAHWTAILERSGVWRVA